MTTAVAHLNKLPINDISGAARLFAAGLAALIAFDVFGQWLSPALGFAQLAPEPLARGTLVTLFGNIPYLQTAGTIVHYLTGIVAYPIGYAFIALPIARAVVPNIHWSIVAVVYGVALWVFALYGMAHLVNGLPAFLGFTGITWVALVGHVLFAVVLGALLPNRK